MGVLRFIWQRVLAFDRIGSRIPQLIQIWLIEFFFVMPLMFFIGKLIDIHGAFGVPGTEERVGRLGWEIAFKPVLMLLVMMYAIVCIPLGVMWFKEKRTIAGVAAAVLSLSGRAGRQPRAGEAAVNAYTP